MPWIVLRNALGRPSTRRFPLEVRPAFERTRGRVTVDLTSCNFCTLCQLRCPTGAITVDKANKTWQIDRLRCILCGVCVDACTKKCPRMDTLYAPPMTGKQVAVYRPGKVDVSGN